MERKKATQGWKKRGAGRAILDSALKEAGFPASLKLLDKIYLFVETVIDETSYEVVLSGTVKSVDIVDGRVAITGATHYLGREGVVQGFMQTTAGWKACGPDETGYHTTKLVGEMYFYND